MKVTQCTFAPHASQILEVFAVAIPAASIATLLLSIFWRESYLALAIAALIWNGLRGVSAFVGVAGSV